MLRWPEFADVTRPCAAHSQLCTIQAVADGQLTEALRAHNM